MLSPDHEIVVLAADLDGQVDVLFDQVIIQAQGVQAAPRQHRQVVKLAALDVLVQLLAVVGNAIDEVPDLGFLDQFELLENRQLGQ